jgi:hypothetical protein
LTSLPAAQYVGSFDGLIADTEGFAAERRCPSSHNLLKFAAKFRRRDVRPA